jgi:hypothetical protein
MARTTTYLLDNIRLEQIPDLLAHILLDEQIQRRGSVYGRKRPSERRSMAQKALQWCCGWYGRQAGHVESGIAAYAVGMALMISNGRPSLVGAARSSPMPTGHYDM